MTITDIDLPDEVVEAAWTAMGKPDWIPVHSLEPAIRAALQAMCDCGRMTQLTEEERTALHRRGLKWPKNVWLIRLDADEREREERK